MSKKNKSSETSKKLTSNLKGEAGFNQYYKELFGERWQVLKSALLEEVKHSQWQNGQVKPYFLDSASIFAASSLPLEGAKTILDLCAAPGGKSLILASLMEENATLVSNDRSPQRKIRLAKVIEDSLPKNVSERVSISCSDGAKWCLRQTECFDRILLDAPCSSERHVLCDPKYLDQWSKSRIKSLAMEQWALLSSAYRMLKPDGYLIYSTCALNPLENDEVVAKLLKKFENATAIFENLENPPKVEEKIKTFTDAVMQNAEKTKFGFHVLPDSSNGAGPLYFSLIKKKL